ncbi:hypothetical protein [Okeania sp. KiyG1]|uniref:hypothetical protein n=1 Tax=Okeania sp. KiyG1 TaxID=2720165 RepID=UPI001920F24C|nr:hypothetical protein [Okeania sp. KiyG1]GGA47001.1 hypothetical protein CYANOKiyG1_66080 [Okeania sp. KiyG1]
MSKSSDSGAFSNFTNQETNDKQPPPKINIDELLTQLKHSHELYYKMLNLEIFALVETLEQFFPGAWSQFMANRQVSMKQFLQHYQSRRAQT